jgi:hypothetical protein
MPPGPFNPNTRESSGSGCGRIALFGAGCLVISIVSVIALVVAASVFWERGSEPVVGWALDRAIGGSSDVSSRVDNIDVAVFEIPAARDFDNRDDYLSHVDQYNREIGQAIEQISRLLSSPQLQDEQWNDDLARELARIRNVRDQARQIDPPDDLQHVHQHWADGIDGVGSAFDSVAEALDDLSPSKLVEAVSSLESASRSYAEMMEARREAEQ